MLTDVEKDALLRWYSREQVLEEARRLVDAGKLEQLEDLLHRRALFPLGRHADLPDYMRQDDGEPLFESNLDPRVDQEKWQDAIEVGWEVVRAELGLSHEDVHLRIAKSQEQDWKEFLESVERRKKKESPS